jgi:hypothetical protein
MGPFKHKREGEHADFIFFFSDRKPLDIEQYEFHKSKASTDAQLNRSYIYLLADVQNANIGQLSEFIDHDAPHSPLRNPELGRAVEDMKLKSFKHRSKAKASALRNKKIDKFRIL